MPRYFLDIIGYARMSRTKSGKPGCFLDKICHRCFDVRKNPLTSDSTSEIFFSLSAVRTAASDTPSYFYVLKKNQNAPRPSEHPPVREEKMSKRLGGIKGCKYKTSSWHLNGFPDGKCRREAHRYTVHLDQSPCRDTRKTLKTKQK